MAKRLHLHRFRKRWRRYRKLRPGSAPGTLHADPDAPKPVIRVMAYGPGEMVGDEVHDPRELGSYLERFPVTWVNVDGLGDTDVLREIGEVFGLHDLALEDVVNVFQRAKVESYPDHLFIVLRMVSLQEGPHPEVHNEQVSLFLGPGYLLSFQEREGDCFGAVRERLRAGRERIRNGSADYLAYALVDAVIDSYFPMLEDFGEILGNLEDEVLGRPRSDVASRIQLVKRDLLSIRRAAWPHREAISQLWRDDTPLVKDDTRLYLRDCYDHVVQLIDLLENYRDVGASLTELHLAMISNRMNDVMKVLTIIATIFIPLGFIAGLYGMNFDPSASPWNMPELGWYWGYPFALGAMTVVAGLMLWYFRRRGWLGDVDTYEEPDDEVPS